jgi:hypothetical protein
MNVRWRPGAASWTQQQQQQQQTALLLTQRRPTQMQQQQQLGALGRLMQWMWILQQWQQ